MKKIFLILSLGLLTACSTSSQLENTQTKAPLDMQAVESYRAKVYSGKTSISHKIKVAEQPANMPLNASDNQPKPRSQGTPNVVIMPSIGYHYGGYGYHRYHRYY